MAPPERAHLLLAEFVHPARRASATHELASLGPAALAAVASLLDGTACNDHGIPLRTFGEAVRCALVTARLMGSAAVPLETQLAAELANEAAFIRAEAAMALGALGSVSDHTAADLAALLHEPNDPGFEAAAAVLRLDLANHPAIKSAIGGSPMARFNLESIARSTRGQR